MQTKLARSSVAALCALVYGSCLHGGTAELSEGHLRTCCCSRHSPYAEASAASPFSLSLNTVLPLLALYPPLPSPHFQSIHSPFMYPIPYFAELFHPRL